MTGVLKHTFELAQQLPEDEQEVIAHILLEKVQAFSVLTKYGHDLTALARKGSFAPLQKREMEIERIFQILARRLKNNPVIFGEPGSERISIITEIARRVSTDDVPEGVKIRCVVALDLEVLTAGTTYRGEFEERLQAVVGAISQLEGLVLLFVDNIHQLVGAGAIENCIDAANVLVPALARGQLQIIGTSTLEMYRTSIERDQALQRRFQEVIMNEG